MDIKQYIGEAVSFIVGGGLFAAANEYRRDKNNQRVTDFDQLAAKFKDLYDENRRLLSEHKEMYTILMNRYLKLEESAKECEKDRIDLKEKILKIEKQINN
jgi:cell division protein FtsI/penicillin-binding protein 2